MEVTLNLQNQIKIENITQRTVSILGGKGSGKTTTLKLILDSFSPILVFDPIGTFRHERYLRVPITKSSISKAPDMAAKVCLLISKKQNVILSFQDMLQIETNAFMDTFLPHLKIRNAIVAFDETHEFVPQSGFSSPEVERYIRFCRNYNVGAILTSQRPATVHKNVLALTDYLIVYRLTWSHDLDAVQKILAPSMGDKASKRILAQIQKQGFLEGLKIDFLSHDQEQETKKLIE